MKHRWVNNTCVKCGLSRQRGSNLATPSCLTHGSDEKYCPRCSTIKPVSSFAADSSRKDGLTACCKTCRRAMVRRWEYNNPDKIRALWKKHSKTEKAVIARSRRNKLEYQRTKEEHRFYRNIRGRFRNIIRYNTGERNTVIRYIGCTRVQFMNHLESKFRDGMTWDNYGSLWEIDHIIPYSTVSKTDKEGIIRLSHYTNTQPLLKWENMIKRNIVYDFASEQTKNQGDTMEV